MSKKRSEPAAVDLPAVAEEPLTPSLLDLDRRILAVLDDWDVTDPRVSRAVEVLLRAAADYDIHDLRRARAYLDERIDQLESSE